MAGHVLEREQLLPISIHEAWDFFSTPRNLGRITPKRMGLVIREPFNDEPAHAGQRITYTVRPVLGVPLAWETLIEQVEPPFLFVDTQLKGPFRLWRHEHRFAEEGGGTRMHDRLEYEMPLGPLGEFAHTIFVRRRINAIFDHRSVTLQHYFPDR